MLTSHLLLPKTLSKRTKMGVLTLFRFVIHVYCSRELGSLIKKGQKILATNCIKFTFG